MEPRFGADFAPVRVHTDGDAAGGAAAVAARAYTVGNDIVFGAGEYAPGSETGRRLLAHELAHVMQQASGTVVARNTVEVGAADSLFEREADRVADAVMSPTAAFTAPLPSAVVGSSDAVRPLRRAADEGLDLGDISLENVMDSEPPTGDGATRPEEDSGTPPGVQLLRWPQRTILQRTPSSCPPYDGYSAAIALEQYNCSGLAHRTYIFTGLVATKAALALGTSIACAATCAAGKVKHWLWEYNLRLQSTSGRTAASPDFHTVAGVSDSSGSDPSDVYSKNGKRPIYGPGTGPSFRPPARERATLSHPSEAPISDRSGNPVDKLRWGYTDSCYCLPCPSQEAPIQGPPPPPSPTPPAVLGIP